MSLAVGCAIGILVGTLFPIRYDQPPAPPIETRLAEDPPVRTASPPDPSTSPSEPAPRRVSGIASTYGPGFDGYLALPEGPGIRVRICGPAACAIRTSNDAGPNLAMQRKGRVVDLDVPTFELVAGTSWRAGLVRVTVEYL